MTKHTPAPWQFQRDTGAVVTNDEIPVAFVNGALLNRVANGSLIAQAPRLLAALKAIVEESGFHDYQEPLFIEARTAISDSERE